MAGVVLLGEIAARLPVLEVSCNRCDRQGRLRTDRLLAEHGPSMAAGFEKFAACHGCSSESATASSRARLMT